MISHTLKDMKIKYKDSHILQIKKSNSEIKKKLYIYNI